MPRPFGRDRIAGVREGKLFLSSEEPKGWRERSPGTATSADHPGTCVRWEGQLFEVEDLETRADGSLTYTLAPWDERHAIRVIETYDEGTEAERKKETRAANHRVGGRTALLLLSPLVGSLPASVQERLDHEYNVRASTMSLASAFPLFLFGTFCFVALRAGAFGGTIDLPMPVLVAGNYLFAESGLRLGVALLQGRGIGTVAGTLLYEVWRHLGRAKARAEGRVVAKEKAVWNVEVEAKVEELDRYGLLEPLLGLLPVDDQIRLAERFAFDGIRWGRVGAIFLLVMFGPLAATSVLGAVVVFEPSDAWKILIFGGVVLEQALRLRRLAGGHLAPSVLGVLVRPFARPLLG